jgi:hypothetical protein
LVVQGDFIVIFSLPACNLLWSNSPLF